MVYLLAVLHGTAYMVSTIIQGVFCAALGLFFLLSHTVYSDMKSCVDRTAQRRRQSKKLNHPTFLIIILNELITVTTGAVNSHHIKPYQGTRDVGSCCFNAGLACVIQHKTNTGEWVEIYLLEINNYDNILFCVYTIYLHCFKPFFIIRIINWS